jgi:hypothetical protein
MKHGLVIILDQIGNVRRHLLDDRVIELLQLCNRASGHSTITNKQNKFVKS